MSSHGSPPVRKHPTARHPPRTLVSISRRSRPSTPDSKEPRSAAGNRTPRYISRDKNRRYSPRSRPASPLEPAAEEPPPQSPTELDRALPAAPVQRHGSPQISPAAAPKFSAKR